MKDTRNNVIIEDIKSVQFCRADLLEGESARRNDKIQFVLPLGRYPGPSFSEDKPINAWHDLYFTATTAKFKEAVARKTSGINVKHSLMLNVPGWDGFDNDMKSYEFPYGTDSIEKHGLILRIVTDAGKVILIGRRKSPVRIKSVLELTSKKSGKKITFERLSDERMNIEVVSKTSSL